ncbi:MAG: hypothetical protein Q4B63_07965 [Clostridium perfringens]|nr:hypothetical protein [Clostridium perfringens]
MKEFNKSELMAIAKKVCTQIKIDTDLAKLKIDGFKLNEGEGGEEYKPIENHIYNGNLEDDWIESGYYTDNEEESDFIQTDFLKNFTIREKNPVQISFRDYRYKDNNPTVDVMITLLGKLSTYKDETGVDIVKEVVYL